MPGFYLDPATGKYFKILADSDQHIANAVTQSVADSRRQQQRRLEERQRELDVRLEKQRKQASQQGQQHQLFSTNVDCSKPRHVKQRLSMMLNTRALGNIWFSTVLVQYQPRYN